MKIPAVPSVIVVLIVVLCLCNIVVMVQSKTDRTGGNSSRERRRRKKESSCHDYTNFQKCKRNRRVCAWDSLREECVTKNADAADTADAADETDIFIPPTTRASPASQDCPIPNPDMPCMALYQPLECRKGQEAAAPCVYDNSCFAAMAGYQATDCSPVTSTPSSPTSSEKDDDNDTSNNSNNNKDNTPSCPVEDNRNVCSQEMVPVTCTGGCSYDNRCKAAAAGYIFTECDEDNSNHATHTSPPFHPIAHGDGHGDGDGGGVPQGAMEAPRSEYPHQDDPSQPHSRLPSSVQTFCYYNARGEDRCLVIEQQGKDHFFDCFNPQTPCPDSGKCVMDFSPQCGPRVCKQVRPSKSKKNQGHDHLETTSTTTTTTTTNPIPIICTMTKCRQSTDCQDGYECVSWAHDCGIAV